MATDYIRYDILAQTALRGVVRTVLADAAKKGLPGEHHFKISFDTTSPGVQLSARMRAQYPAEMTIVLQHQFWDLAVSDTTFEVGLSFGGVGEKVVVPFTAITAFFDPAVQFGFQFEIVEAQPENADAAHGADTAKAPKPADKAATPLPAPAGKTEALPAPAAAAEPPLPDTGGGAEVVRLDKFRKK
jgi:hypothetical protein